MNYNRYEEEHYIKKRKSERDKEYERNRRKRRMCAKLRFLRVICVLCLFALIGRVTYIAVVRGDEYQRKALENIEKRTQARTINPNRGAIVDRNKQNLAISNIIYRMILDVRLMVQQDDKDRARAQHGADADLTSEKVFAELSAITGISEDSLKQYLKKNSDGTLKYDTHYQIIGYVTHAQAIEIKENKDIKHIHLFEETERSYIYGNFAPQVIGFTRGGTSWGLERYYNAQLKGSEGIYYSGGFIGQNAPESIEAVPGHTIVTTLDFTIQQIAQDAADNMLKDYDAKTTSVIVMDPMTGEVLAMAQSPIFNLNKPDDITLTNNEEVKAAWDTLNDNERMDELNRIWKNFNITSTFEPGSIFKPIVVAAALEEGIITPTIPVAYFCGGGKVVTGWEKPIPCHYTPGHGQQTLEEIIANSCNVAMMDIGEMLGRDLFHKYQTEFGYGEKTGIDLPAEGGSASSLIHSLTTLSALDVATGSFGQGFNCTPIQAITSFAALINGGNLMRPYVVSQVIDKNGIVVSENRPTITRKVISKETSDYMRNAMVTVVNSGTGRKAAVEGYNIGGKTGTGQQTVTRDEYTISFIAYLTAENPEILAMALIDRPAEYIEGSTSAAPVLRDVLINIIEYRAIPPSDPDAEPLNVRAVKAENKKLGNYVGMNVRDAIASLNMLGVQYKLLDTEGGIVTRQFPAEGSDVDESSVVLLNIAPSGAEALVAVPDCTGMTLSMAIYVLESCGFVAVTEGVAYPEIITVPDQDLHTSDTEPDDGTAPERNAPPEPVVVSQLPQLGASLPKNTQVIIRTE